MRRPLLSQTSVDSWWDALKTGAEFAGPWGALSGLGLVVWRIVHGAFDQATAMREKGYLVELKRMERERAEYDRDRAAFGAEREAWLRERSTLLEVIRQHKDAAD